MHLQLREVRQALGLTPREVRTRWACAFPNVLPPYQLRRWESGQVRPSVYDLYRLSCLYQQPMEALFHGTPAEGGDAP